LEESGSSLFSLFSDWLPHQNNKKSEMNRNLYSVFSRTTVCHVVYYLYHISKRLSTFIDTWRNEFFFTIVLFVSYTCYRYQKTPRREVPNCKLPGSTSTCWCPHFPSTFFSGFRVANAHKSDSLQPRLNTRSFGAESSQERARDTQETVRPSNELVGTSSTSTPLQRQLSSVVAPSPNKITISAKLQSLGGVSQPLYFTLSFSEIRGLMYRVKYSAVIGLTENP